MTATTLALPGITYKPPPRVSRVALVLFVWLLPFHSLFIAFLFGGLGVTESTVRTIAAWKEAAIVGLLLWVMLRALLSRGPKVRIMAPDVAVTGLIGIATLFALSETVMFRANIPLAAQLYGFRDTVFFMLLYYVGRATPELSDSDSILRQLFRMTLVISAIGILERIFVSPDMLVILGVASYLNDFLGMSAFTVGNEWGLPQNYWSILGGVAVRRAGSVFLHSQGFALPFLLLMPAVTAWALAKPHRRAALVRIAYSALWLALLLSITRMTILVCLVQVALFFVMFRRPEWALGAVFAAGAAGAVAVVLVPGLFDFIWETLTWQTGSSQSHLKDWNKGLTAFLEQPWGHGLGTSDQVAVRFGLPPVSADNMYFMYATQLGVLGLAAIIAVLGTILAKSWSLYRSADDDNRRRFGAVVALATLGIFVNGITSTVFGSTLIAYLYFWFAGAAVTAAQRLPRRPRG